jgi:hypothetical protein
MKSTRLLTSLFFIICVAGCMEPEGLKPDVSALSKDKPITNDAVSAMSINFPTNKWWSYFPNVQGNKYNGTSGASGTNMPNQFNLFGLHPQWIKTIYVNDRIYIFFVLNGNYFLCKSSNGTTVGSAIAITGLRTYVSDNGKITYPEIVVLNGEIYSYALDYEMISFPFARHITYTSKLVGNTFQPISESTAYLDESEFPLPKYSVWGPTFVQLNGTYYLFYFRASEMRYLSSPDGINWNTTARACDNCFWNSDYRPTGSAMDGVTFGGKIYLSYRTAENQVGYFKFDGVNGVPHRFINYKTSGINVPIATDGNRLYLSYKGNTLNYNMMLYSDTNGGNWTEVNVQGSSSSSYRELLYIPD